MAKYKSQQDLDAEYGSPEGANFPLTATDMLTAQTTTPDGPSPVVTKHPDVVDRSAQIQQNLPAGSTGFAETPNRNMVDVFKPGGMTDTYYKNQAGGIGDVFSKQAPTSQDDGGYISQIHQDKQSMNIMAEAEHDVEMANLAPLMGQPDYDARVQMSVQTLALKKNDIYAWERDMNSKIALVNADDTAGPLHRRAAIDNIIANTSKPIYIDTGRTMQSRAVNSGGIPPQKLRERLGKFEAKFDTMNYSGSDYISSREQAENQASIMFGVNWDDIPEVTQMIEQKFPSGTNIPQQTTTTPAAKTPGKPTTQVPPKNYPNAKWDGTHKTWTIVRDGRLIGVSD